MKVSEEFRKQFLNKRKDKALSYCGYGVDFENGKLNITKKNIYYINYYKDFTKNIKKELKSNKKNKIVIKLDIQNFFDEISIPTLLELLELFIKPSEKQQMGFDAHTREQIIFFFRFITNDGKGIPQSDNDIISSFIGNLYLLFGDLFIEQELSEYKDFCELYKIILYIDDIYISITYKDNINNNNKEEYVESICSRISYLLYYKLCLRLNLKTKIFFLDKEDQFEQLISSLKKVSSEHYEIDDIDDDCQDDYEEKINKIFNTLEQLKHIPMNPVTFDRGSHGEILKGVFDKAVLQMLEIDDNKKRIQKIFADFDFNYVKEYPLPIMLVLLKEPSSEKLFRDFLIKKKCHLTTRDVNIMFRYLCQKDFTDRDVLYNIKSYENMKDIIDLLDNPIIPFESPGYYNLLKTKIHNILDMPFVIEQIRYRVFNERIKYYSVALNHLVNEIHGICFGLEKPSKPKDYDSNKVIEFICSRGVPLENCISIRNLFDRRNINQVSHPGSEENITWSVTAHEYNEFRKEVGKCLAKLL